MTGPFAIAEMTLEASGALGWSLRFSAIGFLILGLSLCYPGYWRSFAGAS
jgi:hypothetical protein